MNKILTDPLRRKLAKTTFNAHMTKLKQEGHIRGVKAEHSESFELGDAL